MMMNAPKKLGDDFLGGVADDLEAFRAREQAFELCCSSPSRRMQFSTMMTAPSTIKAEVERAEAHQVAADF